MIKINLVPQEILDKEQQRQRNIQLVLGVIIFAAFVVALTMFRLNTLRKADADLEAINNEYKTKWADIGMKLDAKKGAVDEIKRRLGVITDLLTGRSLYPNFMADMSQAMPSDVWVTNISTTRDPNSLKVNAQAISSSAPGVTRWVRTMQKPGVFGNFGEPSISAITASDDPVTNGKQYAFSINFVYTHKS